MTSNSDNFVDPADDEDWVALLELEPVPLCHQLHPNLAQHHQDVHQGAGIVTLRT